jgi:hypothetical protein
MAASVAPAVRAEVRGDQWEKASVKRRGGRTLRLEVRRVVLMRGSLPKLRLMKYAHLLTS